VYDLVAMDYGPLFEAPNDGVAIRNFNQFLQSTPFKDDFTLYRVAQTYRKGNLFDIDVPKMPIQIDVSIPQSLEDVVHG
jgi:hypothetical protein